MSGSVAYFDVGDDAGDFEDLRDSGYSGPGWYYYDETWSNIYGPYMTEGMACAAYAESLEGAPVGSPPEQAQQGEQLNAMQRFSNRFPVTALLLLIPVFIVFALMSFVEEWIRTLTVMPYRVARLYSALWLDLYRNRPHRGVDKNQPTE